MIIEVEVRGHLSRDQFEALNERMHIDGELLEEQDREMILLRDTPGYHEDPTVRERDIRIRRTNGATEIMVKEMKSAGNVARSEHSFALGSLELEEVKHLVKYFGSTQGQWMHRKKRVYQFEGIHWSLVEAVPGIYYYEAEIEVQDQKDIDVAKVSLEKKVKELGLPLFSNEEYKAFIVMLGEKVNKYISW